MIVRVSGRVDSAGAPLFEDTLLGLVQKGEQRLVVDCGGLDYVNSAGLRALLVAAKRLTERGGSMALAGASGQIAQVFDVVGFALIFRSYGTCAEAVAALRNT